MARTGANDTWVRTVVGLSNLVERITPWLLDLGAWIFGGLLAFNLLVLSALLTVGPVDTAVLIATAAIALAVPPGVAGFLLLRLVADMKRVDLERVATQAFVEAGFDVQLAGRAPSRDEARQRRARVVLRYSYVLLAVTAMLTFIDTTAALWHMAWWIGAAFIVMIVISQVIFFVALASTGTDAIWSAPAADSAEPEREKEA